MVPSIAIRRWESAEPKVKLWLKNKHKYVIQNIQINSLPSKVYSHNSTHATVSTELFKLYYFVSPFSFLHLFLNTVLFWLDYSRLFPQSHFPFLCDYVTIFSFCRLRRRKRKMCVKEFVAISVNLLFFLNLSGSHCASWPLRQSFYTGLEGIHQIFTGLHPLVSDTETQCEV